MRFASDNTAGAAPEIMAALEAANAGTTLGYGADPWTKCAERRIADVFERPCAVFLVTTGTAANALALASMTPPWGAVFCHRSAHIEVDECGAPEFYSGGAKLSLLDGPDGKIAPETLERALIEQGAGGVHQAPPKALSLTQATEAGAVYRPLDIATLAESARGRGLGVHMDGTRFANALARTGASPADLSWRAGVDALCLGATKNGALAAEAILVFDRRLHEALAFRRKRGGHLLSKMRYVAAQFDALLADDLWLRLAAHANAMADRMAAGLGAIAGVSIQHPVEANMLFASLPAEAHRALRAAGAEYYLEPGWQSETPDGPTVGVRLVCAWSTTAEEVDRFLAILRGAASGEAEHSL